MTIGWQRMEVPLRFQLSDKILWAPRLTLQVRQVDLTDEAEAVLAPAPPAPRPEPGTRGFLVRSLPIARAQPPLRRSPGYLIYVPSQYPRYYVDLRQPFSAYQEKFSSKTRSTLRRKIRKFSEHGGGSIAWEVYRSVDEIREFFRLARSLSTKTYQERILDAGLPDSEEFASEMESLAAAGQVRAYILFDQGRPVSYLYCPVRRDVLLYQYLGYDPDYAKWSVGTILQWHALESLFEEGRFLFFDFTEGYSEHKRAFATGSLQCADVFFLGRSLGNSLLVNSRRAMDGFSRWSGDTLDRLGLKARIRKLIRRRG